MKITASKQQPAKYRSLDSWAAAMNQEAKKLGYAIEVDVNGIEVYDYGHQLASYPEIEVYWNIDDDGYGEPSVTVNFGSLDSEEFNDPDGIQIVTNQWTEVGKFITKLLNSELDPEAEYVK